MFLDHYQQMDLYFTLKPQPRAPAWGLFYSSISQWDTEVAQTHTQFVYILFYSSNSSVTPEMYVGADDGKLNKLLEIYLDI